MQNAHATMEVHIKPVRDKLREQLNLPGKQRMAAQEQVVKL